MIYLNISQIASFVGQNHYDYITPFNVLWKRYDTENYNKLIATPGNSHPSNMGVTYPLAYEALTKAFSKTLIDADYPMRTPDQHT